MSAAKNSLSGTVPPLNRRLLGNGIQCLTSSRVAVNAELKIIAGPRIQQRAASSRCWTGYFWNAHLASAIARSAAWLLHKRKWCLCKLVDYTVAFYIIDKRLGRTMGGNYDHRKHSEAEGHRRHDNSSGSQHQEGGRLAPRKEYWCPRCDERERSSFPNVKSFMHFLAMARQPGRCL